MIWFGRARYRRARNEQIRSIHGSWTSNATAAETRGRNFLFQVLYDKSSYDSFLGTFRLHVRIMSRSDGHLCLYRVIWNDLWMTHNGWDKVTPILNSSAAWSCPGSRFTTSLKVSVTLNPYRKYVTETFNLQSEKMALLLLVHDFSSLKVSKHASICWFTISDP